jgi:alkylation response protein AidB-like acyl-CoA dehydrogenase
MYRLNAEQHAIVDRAREVADRQIAPHAERVDTDGVFPKESIDALAASGFLGLTAPTAPVARLAPEASRRA